MRRFLQPRVLMALGLISVLLGMRQKSDDAQRERSFSGNVAALTLA